MQIDLKKVQSDLAARVVTIRELKKLRSESGQPNWSGDKARSLIGWQYQVTLLHMVLAHSRGRLHLRKWGSDRYETLEDQEKVARVFWDKYALPAAA
jgi:hypothetical protein